MRPQKVSLIAALTEKGRVVGKSGAIPWHLPDDLKYFREKTLNRAVIMGRKTFESIGRVLPRRLNVVVSRSRPTSDREHGAVAAGAALVWASSLEEALKIVNEDQWKVQLPNLDFSEIMIIGGGEIYRQALPISDRLYLTLIEASFDGDAYFPEWDQFGFRLREDVPSHSITPEGEITYRFTLWDRDSSVSN